MIIRHFYHMFRKLSDTLRMSGYRLLIKKMGQNVLIASRCIISRPYNIEIGDNVFLNTNCMINAEGGLKIGSDTKIGPFTTIWTSNHEFSDITKPIRVQGNRYAPVVIGDDVWIGAQCTILAGINIGRGAVVGAGAIVTKDIPAYAVAAGNPAKIIKMRK